VSIVHYPNNSEGILLTIEILSGSYSLQGVCRHGYDLLAGDTTGFALRRTGADVAIGLRRFVVPIVFGGPHDAFFAAQEI